MKPRTWFYEGETFISPEFKQQGKPFIINQEIKQLWLNSLPKKKTLAERLHEWLTVKREANPLFNKRPTSQTLNEMNQEDLEDMREDSEFER